MESPYSLEAEREVLASCFKGGGVSFTKDEIITTMLSELTPEHFEQPHYKKIFIALQESVKDAGSTDIEWSDVRSAIHEESQARQTLRDLIALDLPPVTKKNTEWRIKKLNSLAQCRGILRVQKTVEAMAKAGDAENAYDELMEGIFSLGRDRFHAGAQPMSYFVPGMKEEIKRRYYNDGIVGLETGMKALDEGCGGLQPKTLTYIGGRPGSMKSVVCGQVAFKVAESDKRVLLGSPEMSAEQYGMRLACKIAGIDYNDYNRGLYTEEQMYLLEEATEALNHDNIIINEGGEQGTGTLRQDLIRFQPDLLIVDYSQLFSPSRPKYSEYADVTMFSKELNSLKKDFKIPILAAVQLSRKVEEREDKRPIKSDVRSSGQIEQDADAIFMLYREREYAKRDESGLWFMEKKNDEGKTVTTEIDPHTLEWVSAKNRHGAREDYMSYTVDGELWLHNERQRSTL